MKLVVARRNESSSSTIAITGELGYTIPFIGTAIFNLVISGSSSRRGGKVTVMFSDLVERRQITGMFCHRVIPARGCALDANPWYRQSVNQPNETVSADGVALSHVVVPVSLQSPV